MGTVPVQTLEQGGHRGPSTLTLDTSSLFLLPMEGQCQGWGGWRVGSPDWGLRRPASLPGVAARRPLRGLQRNTGTCAHDYRCEKALGPSEVGQRGKQPVVQAEEEPVPPVDPRHQAWDMH